MERRKLFIYIACSLDGYIAKPGGNLDFLDRVDQEGEDYCYHDFISRIDTVILGRKTYDWVMARVDKFPHADKKTYVITRTARAEQGNITFYTGLLKELVEELKHQQGKHIFCDGGAEVIHELMKHTLIDEFIVSIVPVLVGEGTRLFKEGQPEQDLELVSVKGFETGLVQLHYKLK